MRRCSPGSYLHRRARPAGRDRRPRREPAPSMPPIASPAVPIGTGGLDSSAIGVPKTQEASVPTAPSYGFAAPADKLTGQPTVVYPVAHAPAPAISSVPTRFEQIKTILAAIGVFAVLFHVIRLIGAVAG